MGSSSVYFSSSLKPSNVPITISNLLKEVSKVDNFSDRLLVLNDHLQKHQDELSMTEPFKSHLPQCMLLLINAIETMKKEVLNVKDGTMSESNERALLEFLSLKRRNYEILQRESSGKFGREEKNACMRFCDQPCKLNHDDKKQKTTLQETRTDQAARQPVKEVAEGTGYGDLNPRVNNEAMNFQSKPLSKPIWRNHRRSWTPELHDRFVEALEYLGGPQVAKPKQIRDVMKVEGLTIDQVKSHLQKYRLSSRRASPANADPLERVEKF